MFSNTKSCGGEQVVNAAREAREERAATRRREAAAIKIQASFRGFRARQAYREKIRSDFDICLGEFKNINVNATLPMPSAAFRAASPLFIHGLDTNDHERLHCYARYILISLRNPSLKQRFIACALSKEISVRWIHHVKQVLCSSLEVLSGLNIDSSTVLSRLLSLHLQLLLELSSTATWPSVPAPLLPPLTKLTDNFLQHLVHAKFYSTIRHVLLCGLCRSRPVLRSAALGTVLTLALRPIRQLPATPRSQMHDYGNDAHSSSFSCAELSTEEAVQSFSSEQQTLAQLLLHVLSVPALLHHVSEILPEGNAMLLANNVFVQCVELLHVEQQLRVVFSCLGPSYSLCLLANLVQLSHHYILQTMKTLSLSETANSAQSNTRNDCANVQEVCDGKHGTVTSTEDTSLSVDFRSVLRKFSGVLRKLLMKCGEYVSNKQCPGNSFSGRAASYPSAGHSSVASSYQWHPVLGWFSQTLDQHLQESLPLVKTQLFFLWSQPLLNAFFEPLGSLISSSCGDINASPSTAEITPQPLIPSSSNSVKVTRSSNSDRFSFFKAVLDKKSIITGSLSSWSSSSSSTTCNKLSSPDVQEVTLSCSLYYLAMQALTQLKMDILMGICYKSNIIIQLWRLLQSFGPNCGLKGFLERLSQASKPSSPECHLVILFCDATAHLVSVLDDLEFYEQQKPFTLSDFTAIASYLNNMCYKLIVQRHIDSRHVWSCSLFSAAHSLLTLLFRRNARRPFVISEKTWHISELKLSLFKDNLMNGNIVEQVLLQTLPHIVPYEERVVFFRANVSAQKSSLAIACSSPHTLITVSRSRLVEDGYRQIMSLSPSAMKNVIRVRFINEQGLDEAGIDQDGVFKEFLEETLKKVLDPSLNLFKMNSENQLYPSPTSALTDNYLQLFEFTGRVLGKALYEGIVIDCPFAGFFISQVIGEQQSALYSSIDQLPSLDPELYKNLTYIKHYDGNIEDLGLTFSYDEERMGELISHELRPAGKLMPVTNDNRIIYIHLMAHFKIHAQIREPVRAFVKGFRSIINPEWLAMFSIPELQRLISGDDRGIDLKDLRRHTKYYGGFHENHRVVCWLWDILENDLTPKELGLFLKFVTSCSKPPLLGFAYLEPPFSIRCVEVSDDEDNGDTVGSVVRGFLTLGRRDPIHRLPSASTCFNLLKLPNYQKKSTLRSKLRYAINSNTGFELS